MVIVISVNSKISKKYQLTATHLTKITNPKWRSLCESGSVFLVSSKRKKSFYDGTRLPNKPILRDPFVNPSCRLGLCQLSVFTKKTLFSTWCLTCLDEAHKKQKKICNQNVTRCKSSHKIVSYGRNDQVIKAIYDA